MGGSKSKPKTRSTITVVATPVAATPDIDTILSTLAGAVYPRQRTIENCIVVWLDAAIEQSNQDKCFVSLRGAINEINFFTELNQCIQFLHGIDEDKVFVIASGSLGAQLVPIIHTLPQLEGIYVFCSKKELHEHWTKSWSKMKGIYTNIQLISQALKETIRRTNEDSIGVSFMTVGLGIFKEKLENLECSFGYTQILKGLLADISRDETSVKLLADYCRDLYRGNTAALAVINEFESDYLSHSPIWWYTRPCFLYQMLNRALKTLEEETTLQMGFFIRDLHQQIELLHQQQISTQQTGERLTTVYRGQCLSKADAEELLKGENGFMAFDGFMFASTNRDVSLKHATDIASQTDKTGVFFQITLSPSHTSIPFASIRGLSYSEMEEDILFSIHSVFRVSKITKINGRKSLYQVDLQSVGDDDPELQRLAHLVQKDEEEEKGWMRIPNYLIHDNQLDKAERFCTRLLEQTSDLREISGCYCQLGYIKTEEKEYEKAIEYLEKATEINEQIPPPNDHYLAITYEYLADVYSAQEEYSEALSYEQKALEIKEKMPPPGHPALATAYIRVFVAYQKIDDYPNMLTFVQKALEIREQTLPPNHPDLAGAYTIIGLVHMFVEDYSTATALENFQKALEIEENAVPLNYEDIAAAHEHIGSLHSRTEDYPAALASYEKVLEIKTKIFPSEHSQIVDAYDELNSICQQMEDYPSAFSYAEKALEIRKKLLPPDHFEIIASYKELATFHQKLKQYSDAIYCLEQLLELLHKFCSDSPQMFANIYHDISQVYLEMRDFSKVISYEEKALEIWEAGPDTDKGCIGIVHQHIGKLYCEKHEYAKALVHYEKAIELYDQIDITELPNIVEIYGDIASAYRSAGVYAKALSYYLKVVAVREQINPDDTKMGSTYESIGFMYKNLKDYAKALEYYERAREAYLIENNGDYIFMKYFEVDIKFVKKKLQQ